MITVNMDNMPNGLGVHLFRQDFTHLGPNSVHEHQLGSTMGNELTLKQMTLSTTRRFKVDIYYPQYASFTYEPVVTLYTSAHQPTLVFDTEITVKDGNSLKFRITNMDFNYADICLMARYEVVNTQERYERQFHKSLDSTLNHE